MQELVFLLNSPMRKSFPFPGREVSEGKEKPRCYVSRGLSLYSERRMKKNGPPQQLGKRIGLKSHNPIGQY